MKPKFGKYSVREEFDSIKCSCCGKTGTIMWDQVSRAREFMREMVGIDGPFMERLSKKPPYPIELVCRGCGGVAVTAYPSTSLHDRREYN